MTLPDDPADFLVLDTEQRADLLLAELAECDDGDEEKTLLSVALATGSRISEA